MKVDATCCDAEVRYPTDYNLLEDGSELIDRLLDKFCARHKAEKPRTHRVEARQAFISLTKKKRKGKKLVDKVRLIQLRCLADLLTFLDFLPGSQAVSSRASAGMIASVSKPFGLLPKDLALIGMVALQSWAIQCKKVQSKLGKAVAYTVMQGKYNYA